MTARIFQAAGAAEKHQARTAPTRPITATSWQPVAWNTAKLVYQLSCGHAAWAKKRTAQSVRCSTCLPADACITSRGETVEGQVWLVFFHGERMVLEPLYRDALQRGK